MLRLMLANKLETKWRIFFKFQILVDLIYELSCDDLARLKNSSLFAKVKLDKNVSDGIEKKKHYNF